MIIVQNKINKLKIYPYYEFVYLIDVKNILAIAN